MSINHVVGNNKIFFIKKSAKLLSYVVLLFLSFFLKINRKNSDLIISTAFYAPWKDNKDFTSIYNKVKDLTLLDHARAYTLWYLSNDLKNLNGNIFDLGCLQGGAGFIMSKANKKGVTYLFDTFEGFLEEGKFHKKKHFVYEDINKVKRNLKKLSRMVRKMVNGLSGMKMERRKGKKLGRVDVGFLKKNGMKIVL